MLALSCMTARPVMAQEILRDAETEAVLRDAVRPLVIAAGLDPRNVDIAIVHDPEINAFVAGGQTVFINSGLITAADNINQVQGVIAHELGHMAGGHVIRFEEGAKNAYAVMLLGLLLGVAAAAAGGSDSGEAAAGILGASQRAAEGKLLAYSREQEATADAAGVKFLDKAHISGRGSLEFFKKLDSLEHRHSYSHSEAASFAQNHPLTPDRIRFLEDSYPRSSAWNAKTDPALEARFQRVKAKLSGYVDPPAQVMLEYPETMQGQPAHYARAYAWHRAAYPDKAMEEVNALLATAPHDPYFLELKGQILLESGHAKDAVAPLREATTLTENQPLIAATFGQALIETGDRTNYPEALRILHAAVDKDRDNPLAWYGMGEIYDRMGDVPHAALCSA
ncbi:MAG: M48 family metalloprotease, partial [Alphaproteobacteria bacterium]|nr:M48 family metalloprotease [Alphaproteobacteria bacterium]